MLFVARPGITANAPHTGRSPQTPLPKKVSHQVLSSNCDIGKTCCHLANAVEKHATKSAENLSDDTVV